jgi:hypothetical protein
MSAAQVVGRPGKLKVSISIASLPVELLAIIFKDVYKQCKRFRFDPFALASVCSFWRKAASLAPEFWTRVAILIDSSSFSVSSVTSVLARSRDLIIENLVVSRNNWIGMTSEREREHVMSVMEVVRPHIQRCRRIVFSVRFSSTLRSFPTDFYGTAEHLHTLKLRCVEDNGGAPPTLNDTSFSATHHEEPFSCPDLTTLDIDGRNYFNSCQRNLHWTELLPTVFRNLSISHFTPVAARGESFTTTRLLLSLYPLFHRLTTIHVNDLHLEESPDPSHGFFRFGLKTIVLESMPSTRCAQKIVTCLGAPQYVHIIRSGLISVFRSFSQSHTILQEIDEGEDLVAFIKKFSDCVLAVRDCPGFNDEVLDAMHHCAPELQDLSIFNCPNISITALKNW